MDVFLFKIHNYHAYILVLFVMVLIPLFFLGYSKYFRLEEITNSCYQQLDEERKRRATIVQTLAIAENSNADLKKKCRLDPGGC